jgi:asparagine synthase (glutamine-hydrolysing)
MCGIAGFAHAGLSIEPIHNALLDQLDRRGPDGRHERTVGPWSLLQSRLAVIDLSPRVSYPMPNETESVWLLFNGEVYNHVELRRELRGRGHSFRTQCDAEVVVHGWEEWGSTVFDRLHGMWAVALADERTGELILARDRVGIKPLAYTTQGAFAFASDAMALVRSGLSAGEPDPAAIEEYLALHYVPGPSTAVQGISELPPASWLRIRAGSAPEIRQWSRPRFTSARPTPLAEIDRIIAQAVDRQLRADVPVGILLSGGLDSALLASYSVAAGTQPIALTIGFPASGDYDETDAARAVATHFGLEHRIRRFETGFVDAISGVGSAFDTPFGDPSAVATLALAELAREHVTVALSGTGGDDLFAGYYRHRMVFLEPALAVLSHLPGPTDPRVGRGGERHTLHRLFGSYAQRLLGARGSTWSERYMALVGSSTSPAALGVVRSDVSLPDARDRVAHRFGLDIGSKTSLDDLQDFELSTYLASNLLVKEDRALMRQGVEGRVPLLDDAVVELATRLPQRDRADVFGGKRALRKLARQRLPRSVTRGPKRGFALPLGALLDGDWRPAAQEWLQDARSDLVDTQELGRRWSAGLLEPLDVWSLAVLVSWESELARHRRNARQLAVT